jgi:NADH-quinone oxidoreductase subunit N
MSSIAANMHFALPEIVVGAGTCLVLLVDLFAGRRYRELTYLAALLTLVAAALVTAGLDAQASGVAFGGAFILDPLARLLKLFSYAVVGAVFLYARSHLARRERGAGEFYLLGLFALLGIMVMISGFSLLSLYLGLELLSLALYAMVAFERESPVAAEAAMKYFVLGAIASGTLLYGMSMLYGITGTLNLADLAAVLRATDARQPAVLIGLAFVLVGVAFKFGAVPFHMWMPDVYHGAPASVTLFVATVPKVAAFALALRLVVDGLAPLHGDWQLMLAALAALSLAIGNIVAIAQTNLKRMLAYSTIAHVGFILLGLVAGGPQGVQAALFYTLVYVIMTAGAFGVIILLSGGNAEAEELADFRGLNRRSPWFAGMMLLIMVSMIGVPPLAGFYAKWWVLAALLDAGHVWLAVIAVVLSVVGAFYYLRVLWLMYFDDTETAAVPQIAMDLRLVLSVNAALVLALGLFPGRLLDLCARILG